MHVAIGKGFLVVKTLFPLGEGKMRTKKKAMSPCAGDT
jgi:hypothetical protein